MSEPLSSVEIEDVLSSIRRLVSEDLRPGVRITRPSESAQNSGSKLILTPALRVVVDERPTTGFEPSPGPAPSAPAIEHIVAVVGAAVAAQNDEWEPEIGDVDTVSSEIGAAVEDWLDSESAAVEPWAEDTEVDLVEFQTVRSAEAYIPDDHQAGLDAAPVDPVLAVPEVPEPDQQVEIPGWAQHSAETLPFGEDDQPQTVAQTLAGTLEPDVAWADEAEARIIAELENERDAAVEPPFAGEQGAAFEEQILRELVRDIIRDELQGGLGERITRNIRKLVRAEIARALATQALD